MVFKWSDFHTPLVLDSLEDKELLWNRKCDQYRDKFARESALREIVEELNIPEVTVDDIRLKIKTIRSRYSSELANVLISQKTASGPEDVYVPKLTWFKQADSFLREFVVPRRSCASCTTTNKTVPEPEIEDESYDVQDAVSIESSDNEVDKKPDVNLIEIFPTEQEQQKPKTNKRAREVNNTVDTNCIDNKKAKLSNDDNEFDYFCKSLAIQLKNMPLRRALICQQKLLEVMTSERLCQLTSTSNN